VRTGFKFGADFRVYPRGKRPGEAHTQWVVNVFPESRRIGMHELSNSVRLAGNVKALLLIAVVDNEDSISYYEAARLVP